MGGAVILAVALNAALDVTYRVDDPVRAYRTHRVARVVAAPGGKAVNTARILHRLDTRVLVTGLLGGATGDRVTALLPDGLRHAFQPVAGETRRTVTVTDPHDATGFWEPGPTVTDAEWRAFCRRYRAWVAVAPVVVLSGSLPPGIEVDGYARLIADAHRYRTPVVLDCDGPALAAALPHHPEVVKPNATELAAAVPDVDITDPAGTVEAAHRLRAAGAGAVVASRGADGLVAVTERTTIVATPGTVVAGNPTGAGDAVVAAVARGLRHGASWPVLARDAVALSAASVAAPAAGDVSVPEYLNHRHLVTVREL